MHYILFLLSIIVFSSCSEQDRPTFPINEFPINTQAIVDHKNEISYTNRFALREQGNDYILINMTKTGAILLFNLNKGTVKRIEVPTELSEVDAVSYEIDSCQFVVGDTLYNLNYADTSIDTLLNLPYSAQNFIVHNLYAENLLKYKNLYYVQLGDESGHNRLAQEGLVFFNRDTSFNFISTPTEMRQNYIHYNEMCIDNIGESFYYIYATTPYLHRADLNKNQDTAVALGASGFISFDTTRLTDMRYIYDYTHETTYNVKLLCSDKHIYLIQRIQMNGKARFILFTYNKDLILESKMDIRHTVDPNFIFFSGRKLIFISLIDKKLFAYEVD